MPRILLIRHGHTELLGKVLYGRLQGIRLSDQGRHDIVRMAEGICQRYRIEQIISSPLDRARETADALAAVAGLSSVSIDESFIEIDFGEWMGKSFEELADDERWKLYNRHRSLYGAPGGESMPQVQARAWSAIQQVVARQSTPDVTLAIVSHGDVIRGLVMLFLGMPLDFIHHLEISPASVTEVLLHNSFPRVVSVNQIF